MGDRDKSSRVVRFCQRAGQTDYIEPARTRLRGSSGKPGRFAKRTVAACADDPAEVDCRPASRLDWGLAPVISNDA